MSGLSGLAGININQLGRTIPGDIDAGRIPNRNTQTTFNNAVDEARRDPPPAPTVMTTPETQGPTSPVVYADPSPVMMAPPVIPTFANQPGMEGFVASYMGLPAAPLQQQSPPEPDPLTRALQSDRTIAALEAMENSPIIRAELNDLHAENARLWHDVIDATYSEIHSTLQDESSPGDSLPELQDELKARAPGNERYAAIVDVAGAELAAIYEAQGRISEVMAPINEAIAEIENGDYGPYYEHIGWDHVEELVIDQMNLSATLNPTPGTIAQHADVLLTYGPDNERFHEIVEAAATELLVTGPAQAAEEVAQAHEEHGPNTALRVLQEHTNPSTVNPVTAALILDQAEPIVLTIAETFTEPDFVPTRRRAPQYSANFAILNGVIDSASRSDIADPTINVVADILAEMPEDNLDFAGIKETVRDGDGVVLPLAIAVALEEEGRVDQANLVVGEVAEGLDHLEERVRQHVNDFFYDGRPIFQPTVEAAAYLGEVPEAAIEEHLEAHPDLIEQLNDHIEYRIEPGGYQIARAAAGLHRFEGEFSDLDNSDALVESGDAIRGSQTDDGAGSTGDDESIELEFAVAFSRSGSIEAQRFLNEFLFESEEAINLSEYYDVPLSGNPGWLLRSSRGVARQLPQLNPSAFFDPQATIDLNSPTGIGLNGFGAFTYGVSLNSILRSDDRDGFDVAYGTQFAIGFVKELAEVTAGLLDLRAQNNLRAANPALGADEVKTQLDDIRTGRFQQIGRGTSSFWTGFTKTFGVFGAAIDGFNAIQQFEDGNYIEGGALTVSTGASLAAVFGPQSWTPWTAAAAVLAAGTMFGKGQYDRVQEANRLEGPTAEFLLFADPDLDPTLAGHLGNHTGEGRSIFPAIQALSDELGVTPSDIYQWFKDVYEVDPDFVPYFVESGLHQLEQDEDGNFIILETDPSFQEILVRGLDKLERDEYGNYLLPAADVDDGGLDIVSQDEDGHYILPQSWYVNYERPDILDVTPQPETVQDLIRIAELGDHPLPVGTDAPGDSPPVDGPGGNSLGVPPTDRGGVDEDDSEIDAANGSDGANGGDAPAGGIEDDNEPPADPEPVIVTPAIGLNVRSGPSVDEPKLGAFTEGTILEPTGNEEQDNAANPWIEIDGTTFRGEDVIGWVAGQYVEPASDDPVFAEPVSVTAESGLNIRSGPSVEQPKLGVFTEGAVLQPTGSGATDSKGAPWIEVTGTTSSGDDVSGWVAADYVEPAGGHLPNVR